MDRTNFRQVIDQLPIGIVIMDQNRKIHYMNQKAIEITGWKKGGNVPYCSYCQLRQVQEGEERCILASDNPLPSFRSHMPNYVDSDADFDMSMTKLKMDENTYQVLQISNPSLESHLEKVKTQELLIHETIRAQEMERKRIARELHDHIGQNIYSIFLGLDLLKRKIDDEKKSERLEKLYSVMEKTVENIQSLTKILRPNMFDYLSFEAALRSSIDDWKKLYHVNFHIKYNVLNEDKLDNESSLHLFRVIQEAVTNAVRHGKATEITIELYGTIDDENIYFQISDNGSGFHPQHSKGHGLGMQHMLERVKMLEGDIKWITEIGGPTRVEGFITIRKEIKE
ncbi:ATP-binding protein [Fervidibacillus halotolerans]|uniref:histidine kinase n=1 Tax=Fervidibacillus halotolerans TaxID=2980027 RepID=A0A9E8RYS3_9BACI|nr:ATP-binding protein [Fervidibacillus halotolerans]WAA13126.1 histidine kinase [Fervidibacillus halotolerans]